MIIHELVQAGTGPMVQSKFGRYPSGTIIAWWPGGVWTLQTVTG